MVLREILSLRSQAVEMEEEAKSPGMQATTRNCKKKKKKARKWILLPLEHPGGMQPVDALLLSQRDPFQIADLQHCKRICCFKPLCGNLLQQQEETNAQVLCVKSLAHTGYFNG